MAARNPEKSVNVVVLGGGYAGQMAAARLAQKGLGVGITVVDRSPVFVERIRLHQVAAGERLRTRPMKDLMPRDVRFVHGSVAAWDVALRRVEVEAPEGGRETLTYDYLVYGLGSRVDTSGVDGVAEHAQVLDDLDRANDVHARIESLANAGGGHVLIAGGGLTGIEAATEIAEQHPRMNVTLATRGRLGDAFSAAGAAHLRATLQRLGVEVHEGVRIVSVDARAAHVADGGAPIAFDLCLWAGGFTAPPLAREAGLPVNARGQVLVDATLRPLGHERIFVAGDAAEVRASDGVELRMSCATAMPMGIHAAEQLAAVLRGSAPAPLRFSYAVQCVSLGRRDGLLQTVDKRDRPLPRVMTGRIGAFLKELICRYTIWSLRAEARLRVPLYRWPKPDRRAPASREAGYSTAGSASS